LINNILDFEKLATEKNELSIELNDISKTISKTIKSLKSSFNKKNIKVIQNSIETVEIQYDEDRMIQVFTNLISNAIKFCEPNIGVIELDYFVKDNFLQISIADNGKGVSQEDQDFIFEKFYQSKNQNTIKPIGTGLGLAITKQIIEKHQGKIWLDTDYKNGAKFHVKIPLI